MNNLDSVFTLKPIAPVNNIKHVQNVTFVYFKDKALVPYWYTHYINIDGQTHLVDFFYPPDWIDPAMDINNPVNRQFNTLLQTTSYKELHFEKAIVLHIYTKAPSHEFSQIINLIYIYKTFNLQDYDIVVNIDVKNLGNSMSSILEVCIDPNKIHYVDDSNKVFIRNGIIYNSNQARENLHVNCLINELKHFRVNKNQYEKICFIKNNGSKNLFSSIRMFDESYINYFSSKGYMFIDPADYNVIDLFNLIQDAKNVIFTWGSNSWVNSSYCNEQNNVMILCHIGYEHEYVTGLPHWKPAICNRLVMVTGLTSDPINDEVYKLFDKKLVELEEGIVE